MIESQESQAMNLDSSPPESTTFLMWCAQQLVGIVVAIILWYCVVPLTLRPLRAFAILARGMEAKYDGEGHFPSLPRESQARIRESADSSRKLKKDMTVGNARRSVRATWRTAVCEVRRAWRKAKR